MKKINVIAYILSLLLFLGACNNSPSLQSNGFANRYGSKDTKCAVTGCSNFITSSGYSNCCTSHSIMCLRCHCPIGWSIEYCSTCVPGTSYESKNTATNSKNEEGKKPSSTPSVFTNKYGTSTTICAIIGCNNYIASSGDTNCCTTHSKKCLECNSYIDSDASLCMDCIAGALDNVSGNSGNTSNQSKCGHAGCAEQGGRFPCMGKNNTCPNYTYCAYDYYCDDCK